MVGGGSCSVQTFRLGWAETFAGQECPIPDWEHAVGHTYIGLPLPSVGERTAAAAVRRCIACVPCAIGLQKSQDMRCCMQRGL